MLIFANTVYATNVGYPSALYKHINFFADPKTGDITFDSIKNKLLEMHVSEADATKQAFAIATVSQINFSTRSKCPFAKFNPTKYGVDSQFHAESSRINKKDGTLNLERLSQLENTWSENYNGKRIITRSTVASFLEHYRALDKTDKTDQRPDPFGFDTIASNAEWDAFFTLFVSGWKPIDGKPGQYEPYVTPEQIDQFFKNPTAAFTTVINQEVPAPKPTA